MTRAGIIKHVVAYLFITSLTACTSDNLQVRRYPFYHDVSEFPESTAKRLEQIWYSAIDVSMFRVIADPQKFDNRSIRIFGVFTSSERGLAIFFDRESYEYGNINNAISISMIGSYIKPEMMHKIEGHYVELVGVFKAETTVDIFLANGELHEVLPILPGNVYLKQRDAASVYPSPETRSNSDFP